MDELQGDNAIILFILIIYGLFSTDYVEVHEGTYIDTKSISKLIIVRVSNKPKRVYPWKKLKLFYIYLRVGETQRSFLLE